MIEINLVKVEKIRPLRNKILRPGFPPSVVVYDCDSDQTCFHIAAKKNNKIIGSATFYEIPHESCQGKIVYRLRGMAVDFNYQKKGIGKKILRFAFQELKKRNVNFLWCNARLVAVNFYKKLNFKVYGEEFNIEHIGPHYVMCIKV